MPRVLVVQDSPPNARQLRLVRETQANQLRQDLEAEGFDVDVCFDALDAISKFTSGAYSLAVIDLTVPGLSGFDVCQKLKQSPKGAEMPILLVFVPTDPAHMVRALESAADSLLAVPYERDHLAARVQALMRTHKSRGLGGLKGADNEIDLAAYTVAAQADKARVLSFLLATFDDLVRTHHELLKCQGELANAQQVAQSFGHELERRVRERTSELMERQELLHQSRKMEVLGEVTGGIAHDFNNILTVVVGNLDSVSAEAKGDPRMKKLSDTALDAAMRGADLTRQLLAFSCKQPLAPRLSDVNDIVSSMTQMLVRLLGDKVDIEVEATEDLWPVVVDPAQFQDAINNVSRNAREAMPNGGKLKFRTRNVVLDNAYADNHLGVTPGEYCHLSIWDNGTGMSPKILARVFEPMFTTKPGPKSSGFGLSTVFGFVKQSGGHVRIESQENTGTVVHIYLPRARTEPAVVEAKGDASPLPPSGNETILLVEDDEQVRKTVAQQLHVLGYRVLEADRAGRALAALDRHADIDLLFTDMILPGGIGGRELAREARIVRPNLRVLFTSGYLRGLRADHQLDPGDVFIGKPYRLRDLAQKVREALGQHQERVAAQA
jgi:signal transduction histidine kinase